MSTLLHHDNLKYLLDYNMAIFNVLGSTYIFLSFYFTVIFFFIQVFQIFLTTCSHTTLLIDLGGLYK